MKLLVSWSSGKDAAWMLHRLRRAGEAEVVGLVTTLERQSGRVAMHGVRRELLRAQAESVGCPLWEVALPSWPCPNRVYEQALEPIWRRARRAGVTAVVFGDLFLEEIRRYREDQLAGTGLEARFPLWREDTASLAREMVAGGLRARLVSVDPERLPTRFLGRDLDASFLEELPSGVDPCGEHGEFHTFAYDGPCFAEAVTFHAGERWEGEAGAWLDLRSGKDPALT